MNWKNPVYTISTGSVLTAPQQAELTKASEAQAVNTKTDIIMQDQGLDLAEPKTITENTAGSSYDESVGTITKEIRKVGANTTVTRTA